MCVCIKTQIIRFEGKVRQPTEFFKMTLWVLAVFKAGRREAYFRQELFVRHQIWGRKISLRQTQNVIYKDRIVFLNTNKCESDRKAGTSIVFTFALNILGAMMLTS